MLRLVIVSVVAVGLLAAPPALADTREQIYRQCQNGALTRHFTAKQIRDARNNIPTDVDQYSDCRDVLARALAAKAAGQGGGGSGGGSAGGGGGGGPSSGGGGGVSLDALTPDDHRAIESAAARGGAPVGVGGSEIAPSAAGLAARAARHRVPAPVLAVLALLALAAAVAAAPAVGSRLGGLTGIATLGRRVLPRRR